MVWTPMAHTPRSDRPSLCTAGYRETAASTIRGWMKRLRVGEPVVLGLDAFDHALALIGAAGTAAPWNCYQTESPLA
ncbi:MAG: hypothetical protein M1826_004371 [Phylliscum demangeonii]|nr:MAG: hypothetical protein M1826_004371 [Phylliscum demangeonii]